MNQVDAHFVDEFTVFGMGIGLPRSAARILGFMHICEPNMQTYTQIQDVLQLSTGSVSIATKLLEDMQLIERVRLPGDRRHYYRLIPNGFVRATKRRLETYSLGYEIAARGLKSHPGDSRLIGLKHLYGFLDTELKDVAQKLEDL
jgi:DNA-binding transcriptional regulator GbsR (MarR family)